MIPFPRLHIAESVINRIQNTLDDIQPVFPSINPAPIPPASPVALGQQIEEETSVPPTPGEIPEDPAAAGAVEESLLGGSPFGGALQGIFQQ
jgi:hypothetical protein